MLAIWGREVPPPEECIASPPPCDDSQPQCDGSQQEPADDEQNAGALPAHAIAQLRQQLQHSINL